MVWSVFHPLHNPVRLNANVRDIRAVAVGSTSFVFECQGLELEDVARATEESGGKWVAKCKSWFEAVNLFTKGPVRFTNA